MDCKVSVIVPVYKVESYLNHCVESIVNQTYENLEIILVDDGSPDNCPKMCDEWTKKDERIKVIHKENGGLSSARNAGLDMMSGDFVYFVDSDDSIKPNTIEVLLKLLIENNCDMSFCRYDRIYDDDNIEKIYQPPFTGEVRTFDEDTFWEYYYEIYNTELGEIAVNMIISCNKLIKAKVFKDIRFEEGRINEDEIIITSLISNCRKIAFADSDYYEYYHHSDSITTADVSNKKRFDAVEIFQRRCVYFAKRKKDYTANAFADYFAKFRWTYFDLKGDADYDKKLIKSYREAYKACAPYLTAAEPRERIFYKSFCINENLFRLLNKIL